MKTNEIKFPPLHQVRPYSLYRVYAIRKSVFAGEEVEVLGEQIGGDLPGRTEAEEVVRSAGIPCQIVHVGGV